MTLNLYAIYSFAQICYETKRVSFNDKINGASPWLEAQPKLKTGKKNQLGTKNTFGCCIHSTSSTNPSSRTVAIIYSIRQFAHEFANRTFQLVLNNTQILIVCCVQRRRSSVVHYLPLYTAMMCFQLSRFLFKCQCQIIKRTLKVLYVKSLLLFTITNHINNKY